MGKRTPNSLHAIPSSLSTFQAEVTSAIHIQRARKQSRVERKAAVDMCCFYLPAQWATPWLQWAAAEKCATSLQAAVDVLGASTLTMMMLGMRAQAAAARAEDARAEATATELAARSAANRSRAANQRDAAAEHDALDAAAQASLQLVFKGRRLSMMIGGATADARHAQEGRDATAAATMSLMFDANASAKSAEELKREAEFAAEASEASNHTISSAAQRLVFSGHDELRNRRRNSLQKFVALREERQAGENRRKSRGSGGSWMTTTSNSNTKSDEQDLADVMFEGIKDDAAVVIQGWVRDRWARDALRQARDMCCFYTPAQ